MKRLDDYINDPRIVDEPMPLREVHAIRLMIYDETKDMTATEKTAYYNQSITEARNKYGLKNGASV